MAPSSSYFRRRSSRKDKNLHVLIVEDDPTTRIIIGMSLSIDPRISFRAAECGSDAIEEARSSTIAFDLVVLDAMLPDMSGVALLQLLLNDVGSIVPPVVILTALRSDRELDRLADAGVIAVIAKPFDPLSFAAQLRHHLAQRNQPCHRWWTAARPDQQLEPR